jgi:hypothetical protein
VQDGEVSTQVAQLHGFGVGVGIGVGVGFELRVGVGLGLTPTRDARSHLTAEGAQGGSQLPGEVGFDMPRCKPWGRLRTGDRRVAGHRAEPARSNKWTRNRKSNSSLVTGGSSSGR